MPKFNIKKYQNSISFLCKKCGKSYNCKQSQKTCPTCGNSLLKTSHRGNIEKSNPFYQMDQQDPYARQDDGAAGSNGGRGANLTRPADEETSGGLGTRFRGKYAPTDFSSNSEETYDKQKQQHIPGSHDDLLQNPPLKDDLDGWFYDSDDPLSTSKQLEEKRKFPEQSTEGKLRKQRQQDKSVSRLNDDSIFNRVQRKQKGVKR